MATLPTSPEELKKERLYSLAHALVIWMSIQATVIAAVFSADAMPAAVETFFQIVLVVSIGINLIASAYMWYYLRSHLLATLDPKKAWDQSTKASVNVLYDVVGLALALIAAASSAVYLLLGVVSLADVVTNIYAYFKR